MRPDRIKTNVKIPEEVYNVVIQYDKEFYHATRPPRIARCRPNSSPIYWVTTVYLFDENNRCIGFGNAHCNTAVDNPSKKRGRDLALGRAVSDYYSQKEIA